MCERQLKEPFYAIDDWCLKNSQLMKNSTEIQRNITYTIHIDHLKKIKNTSTKTYITICMSIYIMSMEKLQWNLCFVTMTC